MVKRLLRGIINTLGASAITIAVLVAAVLCWIASMVYMWFLVGGGIFVMALILMDELTGSKKKGK